MQGLMQELKDKIHNEPGVKELLPRKAFNFF
jgi:hypothetical protein